MKRTVLQGIIILLSLCSIEAMAQKKLPRRLYSEIEDHTFEQRNGPRYRSVLMIEYTDGSTGYANLKEIKRTIPGARRELILGNSVVWGQVGLCAVAITSFGVGIMNVSKGRTPLIVGGFVGCLGGFWGVAKISGRKHKHYDNFLNICNNYYTDQIRKKGDVGFQLNDIAPNEIKFGALNSSTIGINLTWNLSR
jgi:hypothetical protein